MHSILHGEILPKHSGLWSRAKTDNADGTLVADGYNDARH